MTTLLEVHNLDIGHKKALQKKLNFKINEGDIFLLKGNNGVGKSTLLKTLLGHEQALKGKINWTIHREKCHSLPQLINQDFPLSITLGEILESFPLKEKVADMFNSNLKKRRWTDASGGEKQKVLIATRLQQNTEFLILDEPFNHMDKKNIQEITSLLFNLILGKKIKGCILTGHIFVKTKQKIFIKELELL